MDERTLSEVSMQVRKRGREWMQAVTAVYPEITIILYPNTGWKSSLDYELLGPFADGLLEGLGPKATLVDSGVGYHLQTYQQFLDLRAKTQKQGLEKTQVPHLYKQVEQGFGPGCGQWGLLEAEDAFLDSLPSPQREDTWAELRERIADIDLFIAPTRYYADTMAQRAGIPADKLEHIHNGINLDGFEPSALPDDPPVLGYFARMCPEKGLDTLVDAFIRLKQTGQVPGLKLAVGGGCQPFDKAFVAEQKQRLRAAGLLGEASFRPNLDRDAKLAFYRGLTVLSVPAAFGEAFGLYVVEAMASGVPVVAPDDASFPEMVEQNQAGVICEKGSADALADAIGQLLLDRKRLAKCAAAGRQAALQTYNIERMAETFVARLAKLT